MGRVVGTRLRVLLITVALAAVLQLILGSCASDSPGEARPATTTARTATTAAPSSTATSTAPGESPDLPVVFVAPDPELTADQLDEFSLGNRFFNERWVIEGQSDLGNVGLGPLFNAPACAACHPATGVRATPPQGAFEGFGMLVRISTPGVDPTTGAPVPHPVYGDQLQDRAVDGVEPEGTAWTDYVVQQGSYADGTPFEILWPTVTIRDRNYGSLAADTQLSARNAGQLIGMGLLEAISEATILALADPTDADADGVSGRPNAVWNPVSGAVELGRFGWKANIASLEHQVAVAFHGDIGIESTLLPGPTCSADQASCLAGAGAGGGPPEVGADRLDPLLLYMRALDVPTPRTAGDDEAIAGARLFAEFGCSTCHVPTLRTGPSPVGALSDREIAPYTDLLLHDMGFDMGDGRPDFRASGNEWRTPPLWGLGLIPAVDGSLGLLHDGRARTIEEAILWHGAEGGPSRAQFLLASATERRQLIRFLESL